MYGGDVRGAVGVLKFKPHWGSPTSGYGCGIDRKDVDILFENLHQRLLLQW